jgi:hypothetical protein
LIELSTTHNSLHMKIEYDKSAKAIHIKDGLKKVYLILKIMLMLNIANALIRLIGQDRMDSGTLEYVWMAIGCISLIALYFFLFKLSTSERIPVDNIKSLKKKSILERQSFSFELTNGKRRHLGNFKNEAELAEFKDLLETAGIRY